MIKTAGYPGFEHPPEALIKYVEAAGIFTISLKSGTIVSFTPDAKDDFRNWLQSHKIPDIPK